MDDKASRRMKPRNRRPQRRPISYYGHKCWEFVYRHRNPVITSALLIILCALVLGIAARLPAPDASMPADGSRVIDYSTFVHQVKSGNVAAVTIQSADVHVLLKRPLQSSKNTSNNNNLSKQNAPIDVQSWINAIANNDTISATTTQNMATVDEHTAYVHIPANGKTLLMSQLEAANVNITVLPVTQTSPLLSGLVHFFPLLVLLVILLVFFFMRKRQDHGGLMDDRITQIGKSRARRFDRLPEGVKSVQKSSPSTSTHMPTRSGATTSIAKPVAARVETIPSVTFADVAGIDEVKSELVEMVHFLREPEKYARLGAHIPRGALLVGVPGTGKTLLAKAVAGEAQVPFFSISASEFVEMFVGVGASRVRDLFLQARQVAPCVIFIDEIDAVGRKRSMRGGSSDERDQTLNQLLVELDGFNPRQAVIVLAATNRVDTLDKALLRPGRFDRRITVSAPDRAGREAILRVHTRETPLAEDVSLERLARLSTGMTGADLANLVNEAALTAARKDLMALTHQCFEDALARIQLGALRPLIMTEAERRIIAVHEGGHALVAHHLPEADRVNRVTILPRGQSLGVTQFSAEMDHYNFSREMLMARIAVGLGGRMAEELTFGSQRITTGAENDLQVVTDLARKMVTRWGMSERIGLVFADYRPEETYALNMRNLDPDAVPAQSRSLVADAQGNLRMNGSSLVPNRYYTQTMTAKKSGGAMMSALIDAEVQNILKAGRDMARSILSEHAEQLSTLADALIEHEQLDRAHFELVVSKA
ncbi:ATP-dependent zinc metalloprotease FtsH [Dictyobacter alpinus]|uniref:ATP-dependent zinc metalloprotease FtsH n=1 Tax=Dictyobacter alpinus TaxID=2014873 RepID=A0A402B0N3_9CHLR|nr:ATP-dependent zinc metalloprotease FtsH [Dictyobacter alpinus]GCE24914.1 ATP-dependent zinc metalloprotease FtsH [Dictyobacter alpinus]